MFWNGFTDIFWMAPSILFDPLLLLLWLFLILLYRKNLQNHGFVWFLGISVLLNNLNHLSHFSNFMERTIHLQNQEVNLFASAFYVLPVISTFAAWGMVWWKLTKDHPKRMNWRILFGIFFFLDLIICPPATAPFLNGFLVLIFMLIRTDRQPFFWFLMAQFIAVCLVVIQLILSVFSISKGSEF